MTDELQDIISGKNQISHGNLIQTILGYLRTSTATSTDVEREKHFKKQEEKRLIAFINKENLWVNDINYDSYLSEGAEQKVYFNEQKNVWKLNDAIYYQSWTDYFVNLLLNNFFFPDTAYELRGFYKSNEVLYAVVVQPFVLADAVTDLEQVKVFMENNGFVNTRNNDYYNEELGIILEDLHDENVLTQQGVFYFIDTVFYIKK